MAKWTIESKFPRSFTATKGKHIISGTMQPYCIGIYIAIDDTEISSLIQTSVSYKNLKKWEKQFELWRKAGFKVTINEGTLGDYLTAQDIQDYCN